ncbi:MAG: response regulator transcription factor [Prevotella sp.]|nr:response regulator transcription factor [Prevotella sp.]
MTEKRILVVDDEQDLCEILLYNLRAAGFEAEAAYSGETAWNMVHGEGSMVHGYDLLLLDVMMPGISGFELTQRIKADAQTSHIPIIFLTAKDTEDDTLQGFGLGADDYVTKPFSVREVVARVKAVLSRRKPAPDPSSGEGRLISYEGLVLDLGKKKTTVDGESVSLTKTEFELLGLLLQHRGQVFSRQQIFDAVWPEDVVVSDRTVDVNITRMRKKIGRYGSYIVSRQGFGYVFEE